LQTALKLDLIDFEEYLATIARVYDSYISYADTESLQEAAASRWTSSGALVYDKGMLVAFLYDLILRRETSGAVTLKDKYRSIFLQLTGKSIDANKAIIELLSSTVGTREFLKSYVEEIRRVELPDVLAPFGIDVILGSSKSELRVRKHLTQDQLRMLKSLGYRR
jgi:predicted metalloprotease with PDZ domain